MKNKINVALVRLLQFVVFVLFTFMVAVYFGALLLLPLDMVTLLVRLLDTAGVPGIASTLVAVPAVGYLCWMVYQTPGLVALLVDTGVELIKTAKTRMEAFNTLAVAIQG